MVFSKNSTSDTSEHCKCGPMIIIAAIGVLLVFQGLAFGLGFEISFNTGNGNDEICFLLG